MFDSKSGIFDNSKTARQTKEWNCIWVPIGHATSVLLQYDRARIPRCCLGTLARMPSPRKKAIPRPYQPLLHLVDIKFRHCAWETRTMSSSIIRILTWGPRRPKTKPQATDALQWLKTVAIKDRPVHRIKPVLAKEQSLCVSSPKQAKIISPVVCDNNMYNLPATQLE